MTSMIHYHYRYTINETVRDDHKGGNTSHIHPERHDVGWGLTREQAYLDYFERYAGQYPGRR